MREPINKLLLADRRSCDMIESDKFLAVFMVERDVIPLAGIQVG